MMSTRLMGVLAVLAGVVLGSAAVATAEGATIKGKIKWDGKPWKAKSVELNPECAKVHNDDAKAVKKEDVVTNENGTLRNVFVYVKNAPTGEYPVPKEPVVLDQKGCMYTPHVFGVRVGQEVVVKNSDPLAHNIHFVPTKNPEVNKSQPKQGLQDTISFKRPEIASYIKCDVHPWMNAYAHFMEHPFWGVSNDQGAIEIKGLPAGEYTLEAWHEKYGTQELKVKVAQDETKDVEFTFARPKKEGDE